MTDNQELIIALVKKLSNTDYINDAQEMQDNLQEINDLVEEHFRDIPEAGTESEDNE